MTPAEAEARRFAERLARTCAARLGDPAAAVLHGSLTLGDFVPGRSDVDLLVLVDAALADADVAALVEAVAADAAVAPARVDLRVARRRTAARPRPEPELDLHLVIPRPASPAVAVEARNVRERDLLVELSVCRAHGLSLLGPPAAELIGDVRAEWVLAVSDAQLTEWLAGEDDPEHAELAVFTACRGWRFAEERRHCSKREAAEWALARAPEHSVIGAALRRRGGEGPVAIDGTAVRGLLAAARSRVAEARGRAP